MFRNYSSSNIVNNIVVISKIEESCIHLFLINHLVKLLDVPPKNFIFVKTFNSEFPYTEIWFTDQNSKPLEIEDKINIILVINESLKYKN